jgi:hypothetical protein
MTSLRERIFAEIEARLMLLAVEVERQPEGDPAAFPALHILDGGHRTIEGEVGVTRRELSITIEGFAETEFGATAHAQVNELQAQVVTALLADGSNLDGLAEMIEDGDLRVDTAALTSSPRTAFAQDFTIQFATLRHDPSQPA